MRFIFSLFFDRLNILRGTICSKRNNSVGNGFLSCQQGPNLKRHNLFPGEHILCIQLASFQQQLGLLENNLLFTMAGESTVCFKVIYLQEKTKQPQHKIHKISFSQTSNRKSAANYLSFARRTSSARHGLMMLQKTIIIMYQTI